MSEFTNAELFNGCRDEATGPDAGTLAQCDAIEMHGCREDDVYGIEQCDGEKDTEFYSLYLHYRQGAPDGPGVTCITDIKDYDRCRAAMEYLAGRWNLPADCYC